MLFVAGVDHAYRAFFRLSIVLVGLHKFVLVAGIIDILPRTSLDEAQIIRPNPNNRSIFLEEGVCIVRQFSFETGENKWILRDPVQDRARIVAKGVEEHPVDCDREEPESSLDESAEDY